MGAKRKYSRICQGTNIYHYCEIKIQILVDDANGIIRKAGDSAGGLYVVGKKLHSFGPNSK